MQTDKLNWSDVLGLWSTCNFKIIELTIIEIFIAQAKDQELKKSLGAGLELLIVPHIEKMQQFLHKEGLEVPAVPQRKNIDIVGKQMEPNTMIEDDEIANTLKEIFRLGLTLDMQSLSFAVREDVSKLLWDVVNVLRLTFFGTTILKLNVTGQSVSQKGVYLSSTKPSKGCRGATPISREEGTWTVHTGCYHLFIWYILGCGSSEFLPGLPSTFQ